MTKSAPRLTLLCIGAIASALAASNAAKEKLSPEVDAQARRIGLAAGEKIVAFAREQGWLEKAEGAEARRQSPPSCRRRNPARSRPGRRLSKSLTRRTNRKTERR